jgi:S-adenosylmethionine synthetase
MTYLRPDAKSQVTMEYSEKKGARQRIDTIVVSTQHDDFVKPKDAAARLREEADEQMLAKIREDVINILIPRVKATAAATKVLADSSTTTTSTASILRQPHG